MDRGRFRGLRRRQAADGQDAPTTSGPSAMSRPASRTPPSCSTRRSSHRTPATRRSSRARPWPTGRTASSTCTPARRAPCRRSPSIARWMRMEPKDIVFISEYTGGGFGSKATGTINLMIPALLSKKAQWRPVMHRITRDEEHSIGGARPEPARPRQGRLRQGRAASRRSTCSSSPTTAPTSRATTPAAPAAWSRCCTSRRPCAGAVSRS